MSSVIKRIEKTSPLLHKAKAGDKLISINGKEIVDVLDYKFFAYDARVSVVLESPEGRRRVVKLKKPVGADLGLEFETYLMDRARACRNRCLFCFVDQLPRGMRKTLYFKDDDARLSFLTGNYITLTNLSEREIDRGLNPAQAEAVRWQARHAQVEADRRAWVERIEAREAVREARREDGAVLPQAGEAPDGP